MKKNIKNLICTAFLSFCASFLISTAQVQSISEKNIFYLEQTKDKSFYSLKSNFLQKIAKIFNAKIFIETGTFYGNTTAAALPFFKEIHTIELAPKLYDYCSKRFKDDNNVHIYLGNSSEVFPKILPTIKEKVLFWLDGHFSGGVTAMGSEASPIIKEIQAIQKSGISNAIIMIDDIRFFMPLNSPLCNGYPSVTYLYDEILKINKNYSFIIYGDTAIAFLPEEPIIASPVVQACTISRMFDDQSNNGDLRQALDADKIIAKASGSEKATIRFLSEKMGRYGGDELIIHYTLWNGLMLEQENNISQAIEQYRKILKFVPNHRRAAYYLARLT